MSEGERVESGAGTDAGDEEVWYGRRDSSSRETLSCSESCDVHTTTIFGELVSIGPAPAGAASRHLRQRFRLFIFKFRGPLHRGVIKVGVSNTRLTASSWRIAGPSLSSGTLPRIIGSHFLCKP